MCLLPVWTIEDLAVLTGSCLPTKKRFQCWVWGGMWYCVFSLEFCVHLSCWVGRQNSHPSISCHFRSIQCKLGDCWSLRGVTHIAFVLWRFHLVKAISQRVTPFHVTARYMFFSWSYLNSLLCWTIQRNIALLWIFPPFENSIIIHSMLLAVPDLASIFA